MSTWDNVHTIFFYFYHRIDVRVLRVTGAPVFREEADVAPEDEECLVIRLVDAVAALGTLLVVKEPTL